MPAVKKDLRALAKTYTKSAVHTLVGIMTSDHQPAAARVAAANSLLDRGWGKADQLVDVRHTISAEPMSEHEWANRYGADLEAPGRPSEIAH